ncbi:hypothetical protein Daesc_001254 [Daldinia eschscholtzii]|uniref:CENP-V/GFA domain-containing protein n=1 Tax=Daldinia eschscholtzii TaxID=292717 RepID=A0AAX6N181_9PEZI
MVQNQSTKMYRGNCHCTAYVFEVELPETIKTGLEANCSYSYKRGGIYMSPDNDDDITFVKGDPTTLSNYTFGGVKHQAIPPPWTPPKFTGPEPPAEIEAAKIHTGGCHCGAVTLAIKSKPIDSTYDGLIMECDCSICTRNAYCWIYPNKPQVTIVGASGMGYYSFGGGVWRKSFCRTCGVSVHNRIEDYSPEQIEKELPVEQRQWARDHLDWSPVNLRVIDGVDLGALNVTRVNGSERSGPPKPGGYVDP